MSKKVKELFKAVIKGDASLVSRLIDDAVDVHSMNSVGDRLIHLAAANGYNKMVEILLNAGLVSGGTVTLDRLKNTALQYAVYCKNLSTIKLLVSRGADCNMQTKYGNTYLYTMLSRHFVLAAI